MGFSLVNTTEKLLMEYVKSRQPLRVGVTVSLPFLVYCPAPLPLSKSEGDHVLTGLVTTDPLASSSVASGLVLDFFTFQL